MTAATLRVGLIGAGANTRGRHIPGLRALPGIEIVAVCNRRPDSTAAVAQEFEDTIGHRGIPSKGAGFPAPLRLSFVGWRCSAGARDGDANRRVDPPTMTAPALPRFRSGAAPLDTIIPEARTRPRVEVAIVWKGRIPVRTPGKKDKPLR